VTQAYENSGGYFIEHTMRPRETCSRAELHGSFKDQDMLCLRAGNVQIVLRTKAHPAKAVQKDSVTLWNKDIFH